MLSNYWSKTVFTVTVPFKLSVRIKLVIDCLRRSYAAIAIKFDCHGPMCFHFLLENKTDIPTLCCKTIRLKRDIMILYFKSTLSAPNVSDVKFQEQAQN